MVSANYDVDYFLRTGLQGADSIKGILTRNNRSINTFNNILDFGCGCGRINRFWKGTDTYGKSEDFITRLDSILHANWIFR